MAKMKLLGRKLPNIFVRFKPDLNLLQRSSSKSPISDFKKICPVGAALIRDDRRKDVTKICVTVRTRVVTVNFTKESFEFVLIL